MHKPTTTTNNDFYEQIKKVQEELDKQKVERGGLNPPYYPFGQPCPSCGHCPHCGRGGYTHPFISW